VLIVIVVAVVVVVAAVGAAVAWRVRRRPPRPIEAAGAAPTSAPPQPPTETASPIPPARAPPAPPGEPTVGARPGSTASPTAEPAAAPTDVPSGAASTAATPADGTSEPSAETAGAAARVGDDQAAAFGETEAAVSDAAAAAVADVAAGQPPRMQDRLGRTRGRFSGFLRGLRGGRVDDETWETIEAALLGADVGVATTEALMTELRAQVASGAVRDGDGVLAVLREQLRHQLTAAGDASLHLEPGITNVWLFVGVNGVGKTTTIGKLARRQVAAGCSVLLAAGDTFRAAAADQLAMWAGRAEVDIVRGAEGGDPSAVVFDAVQRAAARGQQLVLADTAGRLHTKVNLVEELKKIRRVADRPPGRVTEVLLVLDATTGQNGLVQAREFLGAVGVTGVVLTKLDGTAKGGVVVAIQRELGIPVKLVGLGEGPDDLVPFDAGQFVDALFDETPAAAG
jgi:fused signal recognition particle receptor